MTVSQLIEALKKMPQDIDVEIADEDGIRFDINRVYHLLHVSHSPTNLAIIQAED